MRPLELGLRQGGAGAYQRGDDPGQPLEPVLEEFLKFILSREGQQIILDQAVFVPLRAEQAAASRAMLQ